MRASICSVTLIVAISAAMADPTLADIIKPVKTGPNSRVNVSTTMLGIADSAEKREKPVYDWSANTIPEKIPVRAIMGIEDIKISKKYFELCLK